MFEDLLSAAFVVLNWKTLISISAGTIVGLMIGAIPGLSATMGMALLSPFTFFVEPLVGIPFLIGLFKGGTFGGSVSAILIGTPGTAANAATLLDGYEMCKKGRAGEAILGALHASLVGDFFGTIALIFGAPTLALIAIKFGPHEFFALILFSLTMICYVSGRSLAKGVLAADFFDRPHIESHLASTQKSSPSRLLFNILGGTDVRTCSDRNQPAYYFLPALFNRF